MLRERYPGNGTDELTDSVVTKARRLIELTQKRRPDWSPPPYDPRVLAETLEIPVESSDRLRHWDALLVPLRSGSFRILFNANVRSTGRQNFSIAHEIAHTFLLSAGEGWQYRTERRPRSSLATAEEQAERLCDLAAAELLMPRSCFNAHLSALGSTAATVPVLAARFAVSLEAAALRMLEMSFEPLAVGFFHFAVRPSLVGAPEQAAGLRDLETKYRARRVFRSKGFPFLFPKGKSVPRESVIYRASLATAELHGTETFSLGRRHEVLSVSACSVHNGDNSNGPPTVCAVFELAKS